MKTTLRHIINMAAGLALIHGAQALTTGFTYQGKLASGSGTANGLYDFQFKLFGTPSNPFNDLGTFTTNSVPVSNGLFSVTIDFGSAWDGTDRWLEILVKTNGAGSYATLTPRQAVTSTPYAIYTGSAGWAASASQAGAVLPGTVTGAGIASNQVVRSINGMTDGVSIPTNFWSLTGNVGTTDNNFVGTTDSQALQFRAGNNVGLRVLPTSGRPSVVGGGTDNTVGIDCLNTFIGGGTVNTVTGNNYYATIGAGSGNTIARLGSWYADNSVIGGGINNTNAGFAAVVPGGKQNFAYGEYSFAAGHSAKALHRSAFVWSDCTPGNFQSTASNQFLIRATGGVGIGTNNPQGALHVAGSVIASSFIGNLSGLSGTITNSLTFDTGSAPPFTVNSSTLVNNLNADLLDGKSADAFWQLGGNSGTTALDYLGTSDNQPLELRAYGSRALNLRYASVSLGSLQWNSSINVLGGYWGNTNDSGVIGATIAGGGYEYYSFISTIAHKNRVTGHYGAIGGGFDNIAGYGAVVPGGYDNSATGMGSFAAGRNANATHNGTFVWNDGSSDAYSTSTNRFEVFAGNGVNLSVGSAAVAVDSLKGISLDAADRPIITRGFDAFTSNASNDKPGLGRWGLFMEPFQLVVGIPSDDKPGRSFAVGKYETNGTYTTLMTVNQAGVLTCNTLTLLGGADLAEPFAVSGENIPKGSAMIIDDVNPGRLKMSSEAYDTRVAGIVSGANGISPGIQLQQAGKLEGGENIALSGRVYALADAGAAPIKPGDLLTTSSTPGHIMKAVNPARAQGAIIGKAMSALPAGKGYVLVLVNLQ